MERSPITPTKKQIKKIVEDLRDARIIAGKVTDACPETGVLYLKFEDKSYMCYIEEKRELKMPEVGEHPVLICKRSPNHPNIWLVIARSGSYYPKEEK